MSLLSLGPDADWLRVTMERRWEYVSSKVTLWRKLKFQPAVYKQHQVEDQDAFV